MCCAFEGLDCCKVNRFVTFRESRLFFGKTEGVFVRSLLSTDVTCFFCDVVCCGETDLWIAC